MYEIPSAMLDSFMANPVEPTWSSYAIDKLFSALRGDTREKLQTILLQIDDRFAEMLGPLSETQTNFIRAVTVKIYLDENPKLFTAKELSWLIERFNANPTPQRGLLIVLLIPIEELPDETSRTVITALTGTPGERLIDQLLPQSINAVNRFCRWSEG